MKKVLLIVLGVLVIAIIAAMSFGIKIGSVQIDSQNDYIKIGQIYEIESSSFSVNHLHSYKVVCLNLWATWCVPCVKEMPMLNDVKTKYADRNIEFLSFSVDTDSMKLKKFIEAEKFDFLDITFDNLQYRTAILDFLEDRPTDNKINQYSVPITYLLKNGAVIKKISGALEKGELEAELDIALK